MQYGIRRAYSRGNVAKAKLSEDQSEFVDIRGACPIERYTVRKTGKSFYILKYGTPIDFLDLPLQGAVLDCTFSELFVCMRELASSAHKPGLSELADSLQVLVAQKWLPAYMETFAQAEDQTDKAFHYPASWDWK